ncbi:MAG: ATP-binding protein [Tissierellia bacterium]|nr:ATP-binding protein [Tissierellia bacterium]
MKVVGITTQQELFLASADRNFRINEWLMIEDPVQGPIPAEVVEARTYNRYIPMSLNDDFVDDDVLNSLRAIGYRIDDETIYLAKVRLFEEAPYPIETGSNARHPHFDEVKSKILHGKPESSLILGEIKHTDDLALTMDGEYKNLLQTMIDGETKEQDGVPYLLDLRSMHQYPHIGIFGGSGSGKSFGLRVVLEEMIANGFPTIVLDPHYEMDFSQGGERFVSRWIALQLGVDVGVPFNELTTGDLKQLLETSSKLTEPMEGALEAIHWKNDSFESFHQRLDDLIISIDLGESGVRDELSNASTAIEKEQWNRRYKLIGKYGRSFHSSVLTGIMWRLNRLKKQNIFDKSHDIIMESMQSGKLVVLQGNTRLLQVFSTYLLYKLYHQRRNYRDALYLGEQVDYFPPFVIVTDEAHNFAPKGLDIPSKGIFREIAQEGRKYGVFLILATQRPTLLDETVTAQLNTKCIFRTVRASDINTIREETDLTGEEAKRLPYLKTGDVFISSAMVGRTNYVRIRKAHTESPHGENPFDELKRATIKQDEDFFSVVEEHLPIEDWRITEVISAIEKKHRAVYTIDYFISLLDDQVRKGVLLKKEVLFGSEYYLNQA